MQRFAGWTLVGLGAVHAIVLGMDALPSLDHWAGGGLWSLAHLHSLELQSRELLTSNAAFWATLGSAAGPLAILGGLIAWLAQCRIRLPTFVGWSLAAWALAASAVMQPSGFPVVFIVGALLVIADRPRASNFTPTPMADVDTFPDRRKHDSISRARMEDTRRKQMADLPSNLPGSAPAAGSAAVDRSPPSAAADPK